MKMTKKITLAALAALSLAFTGCDGLLDSSLTDIFQTNFGEDIFSYSDNDTEDGLGKWSINKTNEDTEKYIRGMQFLQTKHSDIAGLVSIEGQNGGVVGLAFDVTQNKDKTLDNYKTYNFCLAGTRYYDNGTGAKVQYYVSYYANISADEMCENNFGAVKKDDDGNYTKDTIKKDAVDPECYTPYEVELCTYTTISGIYPDDSNTVSFVIDIDEIADDDDAATTYGAGSYFVNIYSVEAYNEKAMKFNDDKADYLLSSSRVDASTIGKTGAKQEKVGVYANVYPTVEGSTATLKATVKIADLTNAAIAE